MFLLLAVVLPSVTLGSIDLRWGGGAPQFGGPRPGGVAARAHPAAHAEEHVRGAVGPRAIFSEPRHGALRGPPGGVDHRGRLQGIRSSRGNPW